MDNSIFKIGERTIPDKNGNLVHAESYRKYSFAGLPVGKVVYIIDENKDIFQIYYRVKTWLVVKNGINISSGRIPKRAELAEPLFFERSVKVLVWRGLNKVLKKATRKNISWKTGKIISILIIDTPI